MIKNKKLVIVVTLLFIFYLISCHGIYKYSNKDAVTYAKEHKAVKSKCMCALYVMNAIRHGGCYDCYLVPAYAYNEILPKLGFTKVSTTNYIPEYGDISVLPRNKSSCFGHIAIYDGKHWISDFEQKDIYPGQAYRTNKEFQIFRIKDGWHQTHLSINPIDMCSYIGTLIKGINKIKF